MFNELTSVDGIMGSFNKLIAKLDALKERHTGSILEHAAEINRRNALVENSQAEIAKAQSVRDKLAAIVAA